jgi:NAD-dependent histone deacetylase SIR2
MTSSEQDPSVNTPSSSSSTTPTNPFQTGKDLFTSTTAFATPHSTSLYLRFIAGLLLASRQAEPTEAHRLLKHMEDKGKLLRLWTQNIDGLEGKVGLRGVKPIVGDQEFDGMYTVPPITAGPSTPSSSSSSSTPSRKPSTSKPTSRSPTKSNQPTTMELHGNVHYSRCNLCSEEYVTRRVWVDDWVKGMAVECEACGIRGELARGSSGGTWA